MRHAFLPSGIFNGAEMRRSLSHSPLRPLILPLHVPCEYVVVRASRHYTVSLRSLPFETNKVLVAALSPLPWTRRLKRHRRHTLHYSQTVHRRVERVREGRQKSLFLIKDGSIVTVNSVASTPLHSQSILDVNRKEEHREMRHSRQYRDTV